MDQTVTSQRHSPRGDQHEVMAAVKIDRPLRLSEVLADIANSDKIKDDPELAPGTYVIRAKVDVSRRA